MKTHVSLPLLGRPKSPRLVVRFSVLVRREGGSLSMTIPRHVVRRWKLEPGARLVIRSTDEGILLYPRYYAPFVDRPRVNTDVDDEYDETDATDDGAGVDDESPFGMVSGEEPPPATAR